MHADFGGAEFTRLANTPQDLLQGQEVALLGSMTAAKSTEAAALDTDVRKIDVAVDDVRYTIPCLPEAQSVG